MAKKSITKKVKKTTKNVSKKVAAGASAAGHKVAAGASAAGGKMKDAWGSMKNKFGGKGKDEEE